VFHECETFLDMNIRSAMMRPQPSTLSNRGVQDIVVALVVLHSSGMSVAYGVDNTPPLKVNRWFDDFRSGSVPVGKMFSHRGRT
jgi:hypothetical protein